MNIIKDSSTWLAKAAKGNPVITTAVVILFYFPFNILEATVEELLFGKRFEHWLDPIIISGFIAYSAYAVYSCAIYNSLPAKQKIERYEKTLDEILEPTEPDYYMGIRCGVEDKEIYDRYGAAEYGYDEGKEYCQLIAQQARNEK